MPPNRNWEEGLVSPSDAYEHALLAVARGAAAGLAHVPAWMKGSMRKAPTVVFDLNGRALFYDFEVRRGDASLGYVRTAADPDVGTADVALELGGRGWSFDASAKKLAPRVRKAYPDARIGAPRLVCYSYPKLGVLFELEGPGVPARVVYDVASLAPVPERPQKEVEGAYAWSFLDSIPDRERAARRKRFTAFEKARLAVAARARRDMVAARTLDVAAAAVALKWKSTKTRTLQFCDHYDETEARSHHCFSLHAQEVNDYCAVATCQMVLCYYRYDYSQDDIAPRLGYAPGGCPSDQSGGWKALTSNHLDASFDGAPTWEKGRDEIEAVHPFKSGIPGHARACAGYSRTIWLLPFVGVTDRKLYIYDPWPWNADLKLGGAVYWENWDSITHTNYVTAKLDHP